MTLEATLVRVVIDEAGTRLEVYDSSAEEWELEAEDAEVLRLLDAMRDFVAVHAPKAK